MSNSLDYSNEHKKSALGFNIPEFLLIGAGPTNLPERTVKALATQTLNPIGEEMFQLMDEVKSMVKYFLQTKNRFTLVAQTTGNGGNEAVVINLLDPGEKLLVAIGGLWGEKVMLMAKKHSKIFNFFISMRIALICHMITITS